MNSKLTILANRKPLNLGDDFSISVEMSNPLFNDNEMFSYPVSLPTEGNRHFIKNIDDINAEDRPVNYEHTPMQIIAEGIPFASGTAIMQEDEAIEDTFSMNIDASTQSFQDLIGNMQCREVPIPDEDKEALKIGEKIGNVKVSIDYKYHARVSYDGKKDDDDVYSDKDDNITSVIEPQALGFSYPGICEVSQNQIAIASKTVKTYKNGSVIVPKVSKSFINVSDAYGESARAAGATPAKFCNARICYKHYDIDEEGNTSNSVVQAKDSTNLYEDKSPYWVLEADRPQSGICFYVLYFLDCLFKHLGVQFDKSALLAVEDFKHLCFFTTHCRYDVEPAYGTWYTEDDPEVQQGIKKIGDIKSYYYNTIEEINQWLASRGCGGELTLEDPEPKQVQSFLLYEKGVSQPIEIKVGKDHVDSIKIESTITSKSVSANILSMYANSENFPDESVSTLIDALESAFGIKFSYDYEQKKVTAYLIRDVFRKQNPTPRKFHAKVLSMTPVTEKITGVSMRYSEEADRKEQKQYVKDSHRNINMGYDTDYNYIDYPKDMTVYREHLYQDIFRNLSNSDKHVYIDLTTGNAYRIKVDSEATTTDELRATLFEVGQWKGVDYGDCSPMNEEFVHDIVIDFQPITFSDVNYKRELLLASGSTTGTYRGKEYSITNINDEDLQPILAAYIDEDMEHEFVEQRIRNTVSSSWADFYLTEILKLVENYDPSQTDDGNSPLQSYDWGLSIAMMRGGGTDLTTQSFDPNYDGFGNSKWCTVTGAYALTSDTMDMWGNEFDYNGTQEGLGSGERFSLKIRAFKQPEWAEQPLCNANVRNRGLFETFIIDLAYFLLHRKKYRVRCLATVAQVADIPNHWKEWWDIDGKKCLINKVNTDISVAEGMDVVELEIYSI